MDIVAVQTAVNKLCLYDSKSSDDVVSTPFVYATLNCDYWKIG